MSGRDEAALERVREELRRRGYLRHRLGRFLLQDGLRPRGVAAAVAALAGKVALVGGAGLGLVAALALGLANGLFAASPLDLPLLFLHLALPAAVALAALFLLLAGALVAALRLLPGGRVEAAPQLLAAGVVAALLVAALWRGGAALAALPGWQVALLALLVPVAAWGLVELLGRGLLALAVRLTRAAPTAALPSRRLLALALLLAGATLALPLAERLLAGRPPAAPSAVPVAAAAPLLLVGLDGVLAEELDYLLARGELPALAALARESATAAFLRPEGAPASLWTTLATGVGPERHGVVALDAVAPLGLSVPLGRTGPLRPYLLGVAAPLGLAEVRPLLAGRRRAWTVWELAGRGGAPVAAVNWWGTFPAEPVPGLVVAHGAAQLLAGEGTGAVAPAVRTEEIAALARTLAGGAEGPGLEAAPPEEAARVRAQALGPDALYREVAAAEAARGAAVLALYLPGADIAAEGWRGSGLALADLVRGELAAADRWLAQHAGRFGTVAVVVDPGRRREGGAGRLLLASRAAGCAGEAAAPLAPEQIGAALFRAAGLPQSAELPEPPPLCQWPAPPARLPGFGERAPTGAASEGEEYLKSLRALGYL